MAIALSLWTAAIAAAFVYFYRRLDRTAFPALLAICFGLEVFGGAVIFFVIRWMS